MTHFCQTSHPHLWYPYTQAKTTPPPLKVKSADGVWLYLEDGRQVLDCISSWWVNLHGHAHPQIAEAIYQQALQLEHVIFAGLTHDPAEQLAEQLIQHLPQPLNRIFYSDNGSTAVEVALKIAYQYWLNQGQPRTTFLAFEGAYHGDTFGAMAVGARSLFTSAFQDLLFAVEFLPFPHTWMEDDQVEQQEAAAIAHLTALLNASPHRYAAILIEPLVQGAGGMRMCRESFLQQLSQVAQQFGILLIFDEVMTGFGRTGDWFACVRSQVSPDLICLSKGLTGGFMPLAVTACSEAIYQTFYSDDPLRTLYHGHSYTANPLGCAAAIASLKLLCENASAFQTMAAKHLQHLQQFQSHPHVHRLRVMGTIAAMDILTPEQDGYLNQVSLKIRQQAIDRGLFLRPLGNVLYLMPPYCISDDELTQIYQGIDEMLSALE